MLFKISVKNIRKSYKEYSIYFLTLILGVSIFYIFNSLDSQAAMKTLSEDSRETIKLMVGLLSGVSIGVAVILGFLVVYANGFLIRRRKREFGIYLSLGMSKRDVSAILLGETFLIGLVSLVIGLMVGIFASQLMSILIAKTFEADVTGYQFVFSKMATIKTIICFGVMFVLVIMFNAVAVGKYKLVELLNASKKNQKIRMKKPAWSVATFLVAVSVLAYCYYNITVGYGNLYQTKTLLIIALGSVATFLFFWSLSGFFLVLCQKSKKFYYRGLNAFMLRQINNKINTMVFAMTIICLMLFVSIGAISTGMTLRDSANADLKVSTPADFSFRANMEEKDSEEPEVILKESGFDQEHLLEGYVKIPVYATEELTLKEVLGEEQVEELNKQFKYIQWDSKTEILALSDYNKLARMYHFKEYSLEEGKYISLCNATFVDEYLRIGLQQEAGLTFAGKTYHAKSNKTEFTILDIGANRTLMNTIVVPDSAIDEENGVFMKEYLFAGNYQASSDKERKDMEEELVSSEFWNKYDQVRAFTTKMMMRKSSVGLSAIVTFIGIYIGVTFLIASAALLALKELSEASDNKERYSLLKKLGVDDSMVNRTLYTQIGIFFMVPLVLAIVHSIFGITFVNKMLIILTGKHILKPILMSVAVYSIIYIMYFISTCFGSKRIIEE